MASLSFPHVQHGLLAIRSGHNQILVAWAEAKVTVSLEKRVETQEKQGLRGRGSFEVRGWLRSMEPDL